MQAVTFAPVFTDLSEVLESIEIDRHYSRWVEGDQVQVRVDFSSARTKGKSSERHTIMGLWISRLPDGDIDHALAEVLVSCHIKLLGPHGRELARCQPTRAGIVAFNLSLYPTARRLWLYRDRTRDARR